MIYRFMYAPGAITCYLTYMQQRSNKCLYYVYIVHVYKFGDIAAGWPSCLFTLYISLCFLWIFPLPVSLLFVLKEVGTFRVALWRHQIEPFFRVTGPLCGKITGPGEFPAQRPVTRSFDVFFDLRPNKRLSKQSWGWWFETPPWSLWRQCNVDQ